MPPQYRYKKRAFLCSPESGENSYVCAVAESSEKGSYPLGNYILTLADCGRAVEIEFSLASLTLIRQSLAKAELIANIFNGFTRALKAEAKLIRDCKAEDAKKSKGEREADKQKALAKRNKNEIRKRSRRRGGRR